MHTRSEERSAHPWWPLLAAALLSLCSNGADSVALAAWLLPVFLLRFTRSQPPLLGLGLAYPVLTGSFMFQFRGMVPIPGIGYYAFVVGYGVALLLPYALDRLVASRLTGLASTLVFPAAWVMAEFLVAFGPFGTWGSAAYTQHDDLPLLQLLSVTGLWGITFLVGWIAAAGNLCWEQGLASPAARRTGLLAVSALAAVLLAGGLRLVLAPPASPAVRVASLSRLRTQAPLDDEVAYRLYTNRLRDTDLPAVRAWAAPIDDDLLQRAGREMQAGARVVFWSEINAFVLKPDEAGLIARGAALAQRYHAYLGMAINAWSPGADKPSENILVLLAPDGQVAWEYAKSRPVPGGEQAMQSPGDGRLKFAATPYGRLSGIICFDGDFPGLLAQAGSEGADLVLDPASDWRAIDPLHTVMASYRAVEQGFNLVRQTSGGLSAAYDYEGRPLAVQDDFTAPDPVMVAELPTRGVRTLYTRFGDGFAWLCAALLLVLTARAVLKRQ